MKKISTLILIFSAAASTLSAQLVVSSSTPSDLVNTIAAGGIAVSNISYTGVSSASGTFLCPGGCNLGITGGIILTSGLASIAALPNTNSGQGNDNGLAMSDPDLNSLTTGLTQDVAILEFDFVAISDSVEFNYIFASDEYSDYANTACNDVFGFFISGPGISGLQDIALIPGTGIPITINNVNNGGPVPHGTPPTGPCMNCAYFVDNSAPVIYTIAYDGMTTILTAKATSIQPGQTYHLKIAIGDVCDGIFDSGVFLEAGTFRISGPAALYVGGNRVMADTVHICQGSSVSLSAPAGFTYLWSTGETTQSITVNTAGTYSATIIGTNFNFPVSTPPVTFIVDNTTIPVPVLTFANNTISSSVNSASYNYSWTFNGMPIQGANNPTVPVSQNGCYAITVQDPGGCFITSDSLCLTNVGIAEISAADIIRLLPNPFTESCTLTFDNPSGNNYTCRIIDLTGRPLRTIENIFTDHIYIKKENLRAGIYFYELINLTKNEMHQGKMVIN
ncbi:MAG TPA: choice-of-anchor L domain-containing protein [Bacteroidia bacterium]|nr:choice-of-anchor L domain-containing protein [Bacteroidia bacterium]